MTTPSSTPSDMGAEPAGLPDSAMLARLANELFAEHLGTLDQPGVAPGHLIGSPLPDRPAPAPSLAPSVGPSEEPVGGIPRTIDEAAEVTLPVSGGDPRVAAGPARPAFPAPELPGRPSAGSSPYYFYDAAADVTLPLSGGDPRVAAPPVRPALPAPELPGRPSAGLPPYYFYDAAADVLGWPSAPAPPATRPEFYFAHPGRWTPGPGPDRPVPTPSAPFDPEMVRGDFPILAERVNGRQLVWLDNAATTQKPRAVIDRLTYFYEHENSNIHRGAHELAARASDAYEAARQSVARFLGAPSSDNIVFVRGTTEAINLVAKSWGPVNVGPDDEILISHLEHHANIIPWQQLAEERGARLRVIPVDDSGQLLLDEYRNLLSDRTRLVAVTHVSNALGTVVPVDEIIHQAHAAGARVLIDGAQSVPHLGVNVQALDPDFYVFSGHKVFGPTGIGALYGKSEVLESMPPWEGGGNMIKEVTFERTTYQAPPTRFEAGTGNIADAVGLGAALDYLQHIGVENVAAYEHGLLEYAITALETVPGLRLIGTAPEKVSVQSFVLDGYEPEDVGTALNREGIAVRAGHHCAQPILRRMGVGATVRPSLSMYNTYGEVDALVDALHRLAADAGATGGGRW
jgi:cysteine desulfurase / selenocysteine lyase